MQINGSQVHQGDTLYHTAYGFGDVIEVTNLTCRVKFTQSNKTLVFSDGGDYNGRRVLYWSQPLVIESQKGKDDSKLRAFIDEVIKFYTEVSK